MAENDKEKSGGRSSVGKVLHVIKGSNEKPTPSPTTPLNQTPLVEKLATLQEKIAPLKGTGTEHYEKLSSLLAKADGLIKSNPAEAQKQLDDLAKVIELARGKYFKDLETVTEPIRNRCQVADALLKDIESAKLAPKPVLAKLRLQMDAAWTLQASTNIDAQKNAGPVLDTLEKLLKEAQEQVGNYATAHKQLEEAKKLIEEKVFKSIRPTRQGELATELTRLTKSIDETFPQEALSKAAEFLKSTKAASDEANNISTVRDEFDRLLTVAEEALKTVDRAITAQTSQKAVPIKKYSGGLIKRLENAKVVLKAEDLATVKTALITVQEIIDQANRYGTGRDAKELVLDQQQADAEREEQARKKSQWETMLERCQEEYKEVSKLVAAAKDGDKAELESIKRAMDNARTTAEKSKDYEGAARQAQIVRNQLVQLAKFPQGAKATSRAEVQKVAERWNKAVSGLKNDLKTFVKEVEEALNADVKESGKGTVDPKVLSALHEIESLSDKFPAKVFDKHLALVADDPAKSSEAVRKASREEALRLVRQYQGILLKDPLVRHVAENPFRGGILTELYNTLHDLDFNIQRCI